jgi:hypothetical protein
MSGAAFFVNEADPAVNPRDARAYCEGRAGATRGLTADDNPHAPGSPAHKAWADGHASVGGGLFKPRDGCADRASFPQAGGEYAYIEDSAGTPASGQITHATGTILAKIHPVDSLGVDHTDLLNAARVGDLLVVGSQQATLTGAPSLANGFFSCYVDAWPTLGTGTYQVLLLPGSPP